MKKLFTFLGVILMSIMMYGQIWTLDFESTSGYYANVNTSDGASDYFVRTDGSNISPTFSGYQGTYFWAAQDIDGDNSIKPDTVISYAINIDTVTDFTFSVLVASAYASSAKWDASDFVHFDYSTDSTNFSPLIWFENDGSTYNSVPMLDTDFDGTGDVSADLSDTFKAFYKDFSVSGTDKIWIRVVVSLDAGSEDIAFDNLQLFEKVTPTKLVITQVTPNPQYANWEFDVTVQAQDDNGTPGNVSQNTTFNLTTSGSGTISTVSGTPEIPAGQNSVTLTVRYDVAETFNLGADRTGGDNLTNATPVSVIIDPMPTQTVSETPDSLVFDKNPTETLHDYGIYVYSGSGNGWYVTSHSGDYFMKASNYVGGSSVPINTWAILPKFTGANNAIANFVSASYADFTTTQTSFSVKISTDYPGYGDPSTATWTNLTFNLPTGNNFADWVKSGNIDLSAYNGQNFYLAFVLSSDGSDNNTVEVDSLVIYNQSSTTAVNEIGNSEFVIYPNPVSSVLYINATGKIEILDNTGRIVKQAVVKGAGNVDVADLQPGIYFARLTDENSSVSVRKFIKR